MDIALRDMSLDTTIIDVLHDLLDDDDGGPDSPDRKPRHHAPSRQYVRDAKAMAATPADWKELPDSYVFVVDMPGLKKEQIKVQVEDGNVLTVTGEKRREKEKDQGVKYLKMERRLGKYLKRFPLPDNADTKKISATYQDGVLTVVVEKKAPREPKKPKTVEVQAA